MEEIKIIRQQLAGMANPTIAGHSKGYLKSAYAFYGVRVPELRKIARNYRTLSIYDAYNLFDELWNSGNHEEMNLGIFILENFKKKLDWQTWKFLSQRMEKAKSWDHIDYLGTSIIGALLLANSELSREIKQLSASRNPWMRRLSIVSQLPSIKKGRIQLALLLAEKLVYDEDIYVQKGAGWMLREACKKNPVQVQEFLKIHRKMKPMALSYATEKIPGFKKMIKRMLEDEKEREKMKEAQLAEKINLES